MHELRTKININAPKEKIWKILTALDQYPDWNPFILFAKGDLKLRKRLEINVKPPNGSLMKFKPKVTTYKHNKEFSWLGSLFMFGIFDGQHLFKIEEKSDGTCDFIHQEKFSGILVPFFWKKLNTETREGFEMMNQALKHKAENESN